MNVNDRVDIGSLDVIFNRMLETITNSKDDIFIISEQSRRSFEDMQNELEIVRQELNLTFDEGDMLEKKTQLAKQRLVVVSKGFDQYTEQQVREAYEAANDYQLKLTLNRATEKQLREKRDDLERQIGRAHV